MLVISGPFSKGRLSRHLLVEMSDVGGSKFWEHCLAFLSANEPEAVA